MYLERTDVAPRKEEPDGSAKLLYRYARRSLRVPWREVDVLFLFLVFYKKFLRRYRLSGWDMIGYPLDESRFLC